MKMNNIQSMRWWIDIAFDDVAQHDFQIDQYNQRLPLNDHRFQTINNMSIVAVCWHK